MTTAELREHARQLRCAFGLEAPRHRLQPQAPAPAPPPPAPADRIVGERVEWVDADWGGR